MVLQADLAQAQTGVGYRFYGETGAFTAARVTTGIGAGPQPGLYIADPATIPTGTVGVYWDCDAAGFTAFEDLSERILVELSAGAGAFTVTIAVNDGVNPLQNARVRLSEGVDIFTGVTDVNGNAVFNLDAATYALSILKTGYQFSRTTIVVTTGTVFNESMSVVAVPASPDDASLCRVFGNLETLDNQPARKVEIIFTLVSPNPTRSDRLIYGRSVPARTDNLGRLTDKNGNPYLDLQRNDNLVPSTTFYQVDCPSLGLVATQITLADTTFDLATVAVESPPAPAVP